MTGSMPTRQRKLLATSCKYSKDDFLFVPARSKVLLNEGTGTNTDLDVLATFMKKKCACFFFLYFVRIVIHHQAYRTWLLATTPIKYVIIMDCA